MSEATIIEGPGGRAVMGPLKPRVAGHRLAADQGSAPSLVRYAADYRARFNECEPKDFGVKAAAHSMALVMVAHRDRYESVALKFANQLPWFVPALLHAMEASLDFGCHLHNGDSLKRRTVHEPAGRPAGGTPPFNWEESAIDALRFDGFQTVPAERWNDVAGVLYQMEGFNGWGTRLYHGVRTPYLWARSNEEEPGKYVADGKWDGSARSKQVGAALLLKTLTTNGDAVFRASAVNQVNA